jgi:glycerophosphoryl diester phosphodiesterase
MKLVDRGVLPYPTLSHRPLVFGHRGASASAPENTLEAFLLARSERADGIELDAMVCGSGEVVVCHDPWLDRLGHSHLCIHRAELRELQRVNVAAFFPAWKGPARIPTLDEVLGELPDLLLNIELKEERIVDGGLARKVADLVRRHEAEHRVVISSFNPLELLRLRATSPRLPVAFLFETEGPAWARGGAPAPLLAAQAVHPQHTAITPARMARWRTAGFRVGAWTVDDPVRATQLAALGVDAIITNRPGAIRPVLERTQRLVRGAPR